MTDDISKVVRDIRYAAGSCYAITPAELDAWANRLESATTPAEVGPESFDFGGVSYVRATDHQQRIATLARQLAEANSELVNLRAANITYASEVANLYGRAGLAESQLAEATRRLGEVEWLLRRYRDEVPLGHQPDMIAHLVDGLLTKEPTK